MERNLQFEQISRADAAEELGRIAHQLANGLLDVDGTRVRVTGPVHLSVELDASHISARLAITVRCHRPDGASRLLKEELARPGG